jgi:hypothetical protein
MDRKKVTGRTDQGTKEFPGDEAYKKLFAKMLEEDKEKEKKKLEQSNKKKEKEEDKEKKSIQQAIKKNYQSIRRLDGSFKKAIARISKLEKTVAKQQKKTTKIISVLKTGKSNIGEKLPGSTGNELQKSLVETNKVLVDILKQMQLQSALEDKERRKLKQKEQTERSKKRLSAKESELEKTSKKLGEETKKKSEKMMSPIKGILDDLLEFILLIGGGIATNAVFEWLKDDKNIQKINDWFGWIKDHWKWVLAGLGAIALIPVISTISGLIGPVGIIVGLIGKAVPLLVGLLLNPLFLKAMLAIGAGVLIYKGGEFLLKKARNLITGGEDFSTAHSQLDQKLADAGLVASGPNAGKIKKKKGTNRGSYTFVDPTDPETIALRDELLKKRKALYALKDKMNAEIKEKQSKLEIIPTPQGRKRSGYVNPNEQARKKVDMEVKEDYNTKISDIMNQIEIEARKMGGPVMSGKPYLVGEGGPELFSPNINGSIMSNYRTEKIYDMISSDMGQGGINMINLPPITNQMPTPEVQVPSGQATDVPEISSINTADPYRQLSPMLYGITV